MSPDQKLRLKLLELCWYQLCRLTEFVRLSDASSSPRCFCLSNAVTAEVGSIVGPTFSLADVRLRVATVFASPVCFVILPDQSIPTGSKINGFAVNDFRQGCRHILRIWLAR